MPEMERADQSWLVLKNQGPNIESCHTGEVLKPKNNRIIFGKNVCEFTWDRGWNVQC